MCTGMSSTISCRSGRKKSQLDHLVAAVKYHCPYCNVFIEHQPELAGERVKCSKCQGEYFEPTDPLPGKLPEKAPPIDDVGTDDGPAEMVAEMKRRGLKAAIIVWDPANPKNARMVHSDNLTREELYDMIMKTAARLLRPN